MATELETKAFNQGRAHAAAQGKLKANPFPGASELWWAWNNGYKKAKTNIETHKRQQRRAP